MRAILASLLLFPSLALASLESLVGDKLVTASGDEIPTSSLQAKLYGLYFSAEWCPPCRAFTPELVKFQEANKDSFQVIFVSADQNAAAQKKYMTGYKMPWPAIPFEASQREELGSKFDITGIPSLIIVDAQGNLVTKNGRAGVSGDPEGAIAKWSKAAP